jgi:hypothetical protein
LICNKEDIGNMTERVINNSPGCYRHISEGQGDTHEEKKRKKRKEMLLSTHFVNEKEQETLLQI